ncbi:MAG: response regulator, partial [Deltaproteobacteria bacterium]|nr:response regulator [Deltaproteobacteria bacterium]
MGKAPVLIADPDSRVASLAAHGLRKAGFEVLTAHRGEDALAMLASVPALVFCEVRLPGVDGFALCENARKEPATREVPFFLLSRDEEKTERERALAAGADDLLRKPLYARDLIALAKIFAGRRSTDSLIEGDLLESPLFYLLRALTSGGRSGELSVPREKASVHFRDGRVIEASADELAGEAALSRLLVLSQGPFTLKLGPVLLRGSMSYSLRDLVTHDEPRRLRFEKAVALLGGPDVRLTIDFPGLTRELPRLPASVEKVVRLFDGKRTLIEALRASDL